MAEIDQAEATFRLAAFEHAHYVAERAAAAAEGASAKAQKFARLAAAAQSDATAAAHAADIAAAEFAEAQNAAAEVPEELALAAGRQPVPQVRAPLRPATATGTAPRGE